MSVWDKFYRLDYLDLAFVNNRSAEKATIYGNGQNRIAISLKVKVVDKDNNPLVIPADELQGRAHLVEYRSGRRLNWEGNAPNNFKPWIYTRHSNDYIIVPSFDTFLSDSYVDTQTGEQEVIFYLYATDVSSGIDIAAGFNVPGVGDFNTSESGANTRNGPRGETGTPFKSPQRRHVRAIPKINYNDKTNIEIIAEPLVFENSFSWMSRFSISGPYLGHQNGEVWSRAVKFKPKNLERFKKWSIVYDIIKNKDVNSDVVPWANALSDQAGFSCIIGPDYPCSVIHRPNKGDGSQAHVNFWYNPEKGNFEINGHYLLEDNSYLYRLAVFGKGTHTRNETPTMYLYKFIIPENNTRQTVWHDASKPVKAQVTDMFGNTGEFGISFDKDNFDIPALS